jgi:hypothetical protein
MKRFILLIRQNIERLNGMSQQGQSRQTEVLLRWILELENSFNFVSAEKLGTEIIQLSNGGSSRKSTEVVSDYIIISAGSFDQAVDLAQECPLLAMEATIEVQPFLMFDNEKN